METLLEKIKICLVVVENDDNTNSIPESLVEYHYENDPDFPVIMEKIRNFNKMMAGLTGDSFEKFLDDKDFEKDIWPVI